MQHFVTCWGVQTTGAHLLERSNAYRRVGCPTDAVGNILPSSRIAQGGVSRCEVRTWRSSIALGARRACGAVDDVIWRASGPVTCSAGKTRTTQPSWPCRFRSVVRVIWHLRISRTDVARTRFRPCRAHAGDAPAVESEIVPVIPRPKGVVPCVDTGRRDVLRTRIRNLFPQSPRIRS